MLVKELKKILSNFNDDVDVSVIDKDQNNCYEIIEWRTCEDHSSEYYWKYLDLVIDIGVD